MVVTDCFSTQLISHTPTDQTQAPDTHANENIAQKKIELELQNDDGIASDINYTLETNEGNSPS